MTLPLIERARQDGLTFVYTPSTPRPDSLVKIRTTPLKRLTPDRPLEPGEQYRFHFDMTKCIGCKCCVVACNEQNGNPASINWRRVGEVEGGHYPYTQRLYLSMGCNHCLEPSCLAGCPVEAYSKNPLTGVVVHDANTCIGCQYCTWNCSYGVPQYNPERGVVGKCDLCHNRLQDGDTPACAAACPEGAIAIEIVNVDQWRSDYASANAPGLPSADDSISTTRITMPTNISPDMGRVDTNRVRPEHPHWPLVFMLVLTQLSVGAFAVLWAMGLTGEPSRLWPQAIASLAVAFLSLGASTLHLGRPAFAWRALKNWRSSWLSREVLTLSLFAGVASAYAGLTFLGAAGTRGLGFLTVLAGVAGATCSARIYMVPARPAWNSIFTPAEFYCTGLLLGPLFVQATGISQVDWMAWAGAAGAVGQLVNQLMKLLWLARSDVHEMRASSLLLSGSLRYQLLARLALLVLGGVVLPLVSTSAAAAVAALLLALSGEILGRWLFFVSVVPKNIAASFLGGRAA